MGLLLRFIVYINTSCAIVFIRIDRKSFDFNVICARKKSRTQISHDKDSPSDLSFTLVDFFCKISQ